MEDTMTITELATRLNVTRPYARKLLAAGTLRAITPADGSEPVVDRVEAEAYCEKRRAERAQAMREYIEASQKQRR